MNCQTKLIAVSHSYLFNNLINSWTVGYIHRDTKITDEQVFEIIRYFILQAYGDVDDNPGMMNPIFYQLSMLIYIYIYIYIYIIFPSWPNNYLECL